MPGSRLPTSWSLAPRLTWKEEVDCSVRREAVRAREKLLHLYVCHRHAVGCYWGICHVREAVWRNIVSIDKGLIMLVLIIGHFN